MMPHPPFSVLFVIEDDCSRLKSFMAYLQSMPHLKFSVSRQLPAEIANYDVVVTRNLQNEGAGVDDCLAPHAYSKGIRTSNLRI